MAVPDQSIARELVLTEGWNSTCYQILNPGIERWMNGERTGLVGFVRSGRFAIVAGGPVCRVEILDEVLNQWESFAESEGLTVCYFGGEQRLQDRLLNKPAYKTLVMGHQPEWSPREFINAVEEDKSLRAQLHRARDKGVTVAEWNAPRAESNPGIRRALEFWLDHRGLPPLHFLVEPGTLDDLRDRRIFVAECEGRVVGFVTLCPAHARKGWLTEQFVRGEGAPNGVVELMLWTAVQAIWNDGAEYITMGIVPLNQRGVDFGIAEPVWLRFLRGWALAHGRRFYNFQGLDDFKAKFHPSSWQPVVVIVKDESFRLAHLRAIVAAFTQTAPELAILKGMLKAVRSELRTSFGSQPPH